MMRARGMVLVCLLIGLLALSYGSAFAQQPAAQTTVALRPDGFPVKAPGGWNQQHWDETLAACDRITDKARAHRPLDKTEFVESQSCSSLSIEFLNPQKGPLRGSFISPDRPHSGSFISPDRPRPHSAPSSGFPDSPQSENGGSNLSLLPPGSVGPAGVSFAGGGENACAAGQGQPPDVAADVSGTQALELINGPGLYIFDKTGNLQSGPETLANFWFTNNSPPTNNLSDTQVAFEPVAQRWLATTISVTAAKDNGDLYFAFTQGSDARLGWNFYKFLSICSSTGNPAPDMPIVGYNQTWIAIDLQCFPTGGVGATLDQLVLVPRSVLTQSPAPTSLACGQPIAPGGPSVLCEAPPFGGARPSRDVSGNGAENLFLAGSLDNSGSGTPPQIEGA
jgi:hypothetical protein